MILTLISVFVCLGLAIKLMFFSDHHRKESRVFHRIVLLLVVWYAGRHVLNLLFVPGYELSAWRVFVHLTLFIGAFVMKPEYLPWNHKHDA